MKDRSKVNNPASIVLSSFPAKGSTSLNFRTFNRTLRPGGVQRSFWAFVRLLGVPLLLTLATLASTSAQAQNLYVANEGSNTVSVIDTSNNTVVAVVLVGVMPQSAAVTPDGAHVYVANLLSDSVSVIDASTNTVTTTVQLPAGSQPAAVTISPDGTRAYVTGYGANSVFAINTSTNGVVATVSIAPVGTPAGPWGEGLTPDGAHLWVTDIDSSQVSVIDTLKTTVVATIPLPAGSMPTAVVITPNGARAYVAGAGSNSVFVIDTSTNSLVNTISSISGPWGVVIAPDGKHVYVSNTSSTVVSVIDATSNTVVATIGGLSSPLGEAIKSDGTLLYVANYMSSGTVSVIDTSSNKVVGLPVTVGSYPRGVAVKAAAAACSTCGTFPFSSFSVKLEVERSGFNLNGTFNPAAGAPSTGIDPVTQPVTLQVGDFSITVPKGSFRRTPRGKFIFEGVLNGVNLEVQIAAVGISEGGLNYAFHVEARPVSLTGVPGTVTVQFQIGSNTGKTTLSAGYQGVRAAAATGQWGKERHGDRDKDRNRDKDGDHDDR